MIDKKIVILGSTGSVGRQTVEVAEKLGARVLGLAGSVGIDSMEAQARRLMPRFCVMSDETAAKELKIKLADTPISVFGGKQALLDAAVCDDADVIFNSIGQSAGLAPTLCALDAGKTVALANKESIVIAGEIVRRKLNEKGGRIIPVDSEHSAIFQCLEAGKRSDLKRILLTASGGPFFGMTRAEMENISPERALAHPTWSMGAKITVDSSTLMNKGFEVIEAVHLFGVRPEQVEVIVHRESIIHSMVEYNDNAVIAQMSLPDMRLCAQYAMTYPDRIPGIMKQLDLTSIGTLSFSKPDYENFPLLSLAYDCIKKGGVMPAVLTAADEVAVDAFFKKKIGFCSISDVVSEVVGGFSNTASPDIDALTNAIEEAKGKAERLCDNLSQV